MTEPVPRLQVKEQTHKGDEADEENETDFVKERQTRISVCGGHQDSITTLINGTSLPRQELLWKEENSRHFADRWIVCVLYRGLLWRGESILRH
ncbi:hypothetical protein, partial [Petrachloros mirabilis]